MLEEKSDQMYDTVKPVIKNKVDEIQNSLQLLKNIYLTWFRGKEKKMQMHILMVIQPQL